MITSGRIIQVAAEDTFASPSGGYATHAGGWEFGADNIRQRSREKEIGHLWYHKYHYRICISNKTKEINYLYLYLYPEDNLFGKDETVWPAGKNGRTPNLDPAFVKVFSESVGLSFVSDGKGDLRTTYGPEDLLGYIYAVFHSPTYRSRYAEFLKIDFPRVPTPSAAELFGKLAKLGAALMALHLLEADVLNRPSRRFPSPATTP